MVEIPGVFLPHVTITSRHGALWRGEYVDYGELRFESEEFNEAFVVDAGDRRFAFELVDARMMDWLLAFGRELSFEVAGHHAVLWSPQRRPDRLAGLLGAAASFAEHVPRMVLREYAVSIA